jgi:multiple sugar transport system permease protein
MIQWTRRDQAAGLATGGGATTAVTPRWSVAAGAFGILIIAAVLFFLPVIWMVLTSFKDESEYASYPIRIFPEVPRIANYELAVTMFPFLTYLMHSIILSGCYTVLTVITSAAAGFGFSRHRSVPGRDTLFAIVLATMMVPGLVTLVPQYMLFARLGLLNSYWPWILWGISGSPFHIFLFRQFFSSIPKELEDAAEVDGCGKFRIFWQIFLPNSLPAIAASSIFAFTWVWGDWLYPELFLADNITTLAVKLATSYVNPQGIPLMTVTMAGVMIYIIPMIIIFFLAQQYIIQGVVTTGLKG